MMNLDTCEHMYMCTSTPEPVKSVQLNGYIKPKSPGRKHSENRKTLPREHLIGCQGVKIFLLKDPFLSSFFFINLDFSYFKFCHNLSF